MKFWIFLLIGLLSVMEIVFKIIKCASCDDRYLGFDMSGYSYLALQTLIVGILFYNAYREWIKTKSSAK